MDKENPMKKFACIATWLLLFSLMLTGQSGPETLYQSTCAACHTINGGRLVGPDLSGVYERREEDWLIRFIRSSQTMLKAGDSLTVALYEEYNHIPMPDNPLTDQEIRNLLDYIREKDSGFEEAATLGQEAGDTAVVIEPAVTEAVYTEEQRRMGYALFYGKQPFVNGPVSCFGCHTMNDRYTMIGGGKLSTDLSDTYSRLGQAGISAILSNPPFPVMKVALEEKELTVEEVEALTAMFQFADQRFTSNPLEYAGTFTVLVFALVFAMFFVALLYLFYNDRKIPKK